MKIKLPKTISIGGNIITVEFPYTFKHDEELLGLYEHIESNIKITDKWNSKIRSECNVHESLIHEAFHGIDYIYCGGDINHDLLTQLSLGWYQVLVDNIIFTHKSIPNKVKIGGFEFKILKEYEFYDDDGTYAFVNSICQEIGLSTHKTSSEYIKRQLTYVITRAIMYYYFSCEEIDIDDMTLQRFSNGIHQVFKDNKIEALVKSGRK